MDLHELEALAFGDRRQALDTLVAGTVDHDYWHAIALQHAGDLDAVDRLLASWPRRHGARSPLAARLERRQLLLRGGEGVDRQLATALARATSATLDDRAEVAVAAERFPTRLDPTLVDTDRLVAEALDGAPDLRALSDAGLARARPTEATAPSQRREWLRRASPGALGADLVDAIALDLEDRTSRGFGSLPVHDELTLGELHALGERRPELLSHTRWVDAVLRRMRPTEAVDLGRDLAARAAFLDALAAFAATLPPAMLAVGAHIAWHRLELDHRMGRPDRERLLAYLALPRRSDWARAPRREATTGTLGGALDAAAAAGLERVADDTALVRALLAHFLRDDEGHDFAPHLAQDFLADVLAETRLLAGPATAGAPEAERWAATLGPARLAALRERVEIALAPHNPERFAADAPVRLDVDLKNVPELLVKVFRVDPVAYFLARGAELDVSVDLDGLAASEERIVRIEAPPIQRVRRTLELASCDGPGTYVVDLIGNGLASRALIRKGGLRAVSRVGAAGLVVAVLDAEARPRPDARVWLDGREHAPRDEQGTIVIPFSTVGGATRMLLVAGAEAEVAALVHPTESYRLTLALHLERESLVLGGLARLLVRPTLTVAGAPASLGLLEEPTLELAVTDLAGTTSRRTEPLTLSDDAEGVVDLRVPDGLQRLSVLLRARVRVRSRQETIALEDACEADLGGIHATAETESVHLETTADGHTLRLLGKTGEPRERRPLALTLRHFAVTAPVSVTLETDEDGDVDLGPLTGVTDVEARLPSGRTQAFRLDPDVALPTVVHAPPGEAYALSLPLGLAADAVRWRLVERRDGAAHRDATAALRVEPGALHLAPLDPGSYTLHGLGLRGPLGPVAIVVGQARSDGAREGLAALGDRLLERSPEPARVHRLAVHGDRLTLALGGALGASTRVHAIGLRYRPDPALPRTLVSGLPTPRAHHREPRLSYYVSGRDIGDEHRYVLDRRRAPRRPGTLLEKPPLLLHPWALRTTTTVTQGARTGSRFFAPPAPPPAPAPMMQGYGPSAKAASSSDGAFVALDFLARAAPVLANLRPDERGEVQIALGDLGHPQLVRLFIVDARGAAVHDVPLAPSVAPTRDLRLRQALDPARHYREDKAIVAAPAGTTLEVSDVRTDRAELLDSLARAHQMLATLGLDEGQAGMDGLAALAFAVGWHRLDDATRRARASEHACHELHLFLAHHDPIFFEAVIRPTLAHKRHKTFVDRYLLGEDLRASLEPWSFGRLNTLERCLLARRHPDVAPTIARLVADAVDLRPPDPFGDMRLVATLLGTTALEQASSVATVAEKTEASLDDARPMRKRARRREVEEEAGAPPPASEAPPRRARAPGGGGGGEGDMPMDMLLAEESEPLFRAADKTQEWAESDWWRRRVGDVHPGLVPPNRFWRDLARHLADGAAGPFLSPWLGECTTSLPAAMGALALIDLPFEAAAHAVTRDDTRLAIATASHALAARTRLVEVPAATGDAGVLVGQAIFRADDRWAWDGAMQREKPVLGALVAGVVYQCQVVVTNPTSAAQRLEVLLQIPRGALPVAGGAITRTIALDLGAYGTHASEYAFYFPLPTRASHFPAHVIRDGALVAAAPARELDVVVDTPRADAGSWAEVSQHGSLDEVLAYLASHNLGRVDLGRIAWRMHDHAAFERVTTHLAERLVYDDRLWAYALIHRDSDRLPEWTRHQGRLMDDLGPVLDGGLASLDPIARGLYQHLEYAPLIGARAHALGGARRVLNDGLAAQYAAFVDLVAHRAEPNDDDHLAHAHYLFALDRHDEALAALARVRREAVATQLQYDYLAAYAASCRGDLAAARALGERWQDHPVDRWRARFRALLAMLDEVDGARAAAPGPREQPEARGRDQKMAELAARQPTLELAVEGGQVVLQHRHVASCELRFYRMDLELLFSREPFAQGDVERFSWIAPGLALTVALGAGEPERDGAGRATVPLPPGFSGQNLVITAVAPGLRRSLAHYAHDLAVEVAQAYGQLRVLRASTQRPLAATYVKVFARRSDGGTAFYKDGYTDVRGRFDYASLSTDDLDRVSRFALLVASDEAGATVLEALPPGR